MTRTFEYDVFISYSQSDKDTVHALAERLRDDGLAIWLDAWMGAKPAEDAAALKDGLENSRALMICMSTDFFDTDWTALERHTILFRDSANREKRFIPVMLEDCQVPMTISGFARIDWTLGDDESYEKLKAVLEPPRDETDAPEAGAGEHADLEDQTFQLSRIDGVFGAHWLAKFALSQDASQAVVGGRDGELKIWNTETGHPITAEDDVDGMVWTTELSADGAELYTGANSVQVWSLDGTPKLKTTLSGHTAPINCIACVPGSRRIISGSDDSSLIVWDLDKKRRRDVGTLTGHGSRVWDVLVTPDGGKAVSCSSDGTIKIWGLQSFNCLSTLEAHEEDVYSVALSADARLLISCGADRTIKVWEFQTQRLVSTLEGHREKVVTLAMNPGGTRAISGSYDGVLKLWDLEKNRLVSNLGRHGDKIRCVRADTDWTRAVSIGDDGALRVWDLTRFGDQRASDSERYTNAKVALVGESGVGKSGLALRLVKDSWQETGSTHGMEVHRLDLPDLPASDMEREVWLWDFAGQPDYRLIHQLYMDETALALMVFNPQAEAPFAPLGHWEAALERAVEQDPGKLLVAARCDRGGLMISEREIREYMESRGYAAHVDTAAKQEDHPGCVQLLSLIGENIPWDLLPTISTTRLFRTLKDAVLSIKQSGVPLIRVVELDHRLRWIWKGDPFSEQDLRTVIRHLSAQGIIKPLDFGDFVLLQPEQINNYGSAVVRAARDHPTGLAELPERDVLDGTIDFKDMPRLEPEDERILLRAMVQTFIDRRLCYRITPDGGSRLVFPAYFRNPRDEIPRQPNIVVTYNFTGAIDQIYTGLIVRLHYTSDFEIDRLWRYAADYKAFAGGKAGLLLQKEEDGAATIKVYFDDDCSDQTKVSFIKYVHEHLKRESGDVTRVRDYVCPHCKHPVESKRAVAKRLELGKTDMVCQVCDQRFELIDLIETLFASDEFLHNVLEMDKAAQIKLDNESLELILVGHAFSIVGEAGHIFRPIPNSDHGIDGEIEFKNDVGQASGKRLYVQLKSGDSYLYDRKSDDAEVFRIKKPRHAEYWRTQEYPVMLVIRTSDERIRWMDVREYLRRHYNETGEDARQIVFDGEGFTAVSVHDKWRDSI